MAQYSLYKHPLTRRRGKNHSVVNLDGELFTITALLKPPLALAATQLCLEKQCVKYPSLDKGFLRRASNPQRNKKLSSTDVSAP